jgi:Flp pilus assembly protein TadB
MIPDLRVRSQAAAARREFSRQLACFVDLVALERSCGSGTQQALSTASEVGDSWAFRRLRECLDHATWAGIASWDGLRDLADELALPDLSDVADIIRLSGSEGAGIHRILRAKARSIRESRLTADLTQANEANESMSLPVSVLGIIFLVILIAPALLSMMGLTS